MILGIVALAIVYCVYKICHKKVMVHAEQQAAAQARAGAYAANTNGAAAAAEGATATTVFGNQGYTDFSHMSATGYPVDPR